MAIKLYGNPFSPASQRVRHCLEEKEIEYEFELVDFSSGQHKKEPFISLNPFGLVPALQDGDLTLFESRAVTHYIAHNYADKGTPLVPKDPKKMAIVSVWVEVESQSFDSCASKITFELVVKPMLGMPIDESVVATHEAKLASVLDIYESRLAVSKYIGGDEFSLADLHHIPIINSLFGTKIKSLFDARPHVSAWCAEISGRPAWQKVLATMKH